MTQTPDDELFWEDLIAAIRERRVIPVVGEGLIRTTEGELLNSWLAAALRDRLKIPAGLLPAKPDLNQVMCARLITGGGANPLEVAYRRAKQLLTNPPPCDTAPLVNLASIRQFDVILTTTCDEVLLKVLDDVRHQGNPKTRRVAFFPRAPENPQAGYGHLNPDPEKHADHEDGRKKDLPRPKSAEHTGPMEPVLYQLFGQVSFQPGNFVLWDEDLIEFVLQLHLQLEDLPNLGRSLQDNHLLLLGCRFSDWAVRFFLRVAKQGRLSSSSSGTHLPATCHYIADLPLETGTPDPAAGTEAPVILYLDSLKGNVEIIRRDPVDFIAELGERCARAFGKPPPVQLPAEPYDWPEPEMAAGSIFISYSHLDLDAVKKIKTALEDAGCTVWFDQERLRVGDSWENVLEEQVREQCSLFLSIISLTTERRPGYYHTERSWAEARALRHGKAVADFYIPVVIDDMPTLHLYREPKVAGKCQITPLPGGETPGDFAHWVRELQERAMNLNRPPADDTSA